MAGRSLRLAAHVYGAVQSTSMIRKSESHCLHDNRKEEQLALPSAAIRQSWLHLNLELHLAAIGVESTLKMIIKLLLLALTLLIALLPDTKSYFGFDLRILSKPQLSLPDTFGGSLLANGLLSQADHLYDREIRGPESFALWQGQVYTSLGDGRIVQVLADRLQTVAFLDVGKLGQEQCRQPHNTAKCGRPLGLKFDSKGTLYTVDPYHGLYSVNVATGETRLIVDVSKERGLGARFLDDLAVLEKANGHLVFYLSDASTEWDLYDVAYVVAEHDRTGRLLSYDTETGQVKVELEQLPFPNGLELTDDQSALLVCLFNDRAIYKYQLTGKEKGKLVALAVNLPGEPDNIKRSRDTTRETYWVGLFTGRNQHQPHLLLDTLADLGFLKRFIMRLGRLVGFTIEQAGVFLQNDYLASLGFDIKTGHYMNVGICNYGMAVEVDSTGQIINSLHSPDGRTCSLSEAFEVKQSDGERHFLFGSFGNPYLGRLVLPQSALQYSTVISQLTPNAAEQQYQAPSYKSSPTAKLTIHTNGGKSEL